MNYTAKSLFMKKTARLILLFALIPQIICIALRYVLQYNSLIGLELSGIENTINEIVSFFGIIVEFSSFAFILYYVFIFSSGKNCGIWFVSLLSLFALMFFLSSYSGNNTLGVILMTISAVVSCFGVLFITKGYRLISLYLIGALLLSYIGGMLLILTTDDADSSDIIYNGVYAMINFSIEIIVLLAVICIASFIRQRTADKGESITVGGHYLPHESPILKCGLIVDITYTVVTLIGYILNTAEEIEIYGNPVNATEWIETLTPYIRLSVYFIVGYFIIAFISNLLEDIYFESNDIADEIDVIMRGRKHDLG